MKVLRLHNLYKQPGGEDRAFTSETHLLEERGHCVISHQEDNARIQNGLLTAATAIWNRSSYQSIRAAAIDSKPDVAHFHNTFPLISPAAYYAVRRLGIPVVQTLHNFRLLCPGGLFLRDGYPCEDCLQQRSFRPALRHKCYRDSRPATAAVAAMINVHQLAGTWRRKVDVYVALSHFARRKFIEGGLPPDRIVVQRNFITPDPGIGPGDGRYALFVGRLSGEKGIRTLAEAWTKLPEIPLIVAGDGPLANTPWPRNVTALGHQTRDQVLALMKRATILVFPSIWYENAPLTLLEAFACGLPAIASDIGSIPEIVLDDRTGRLFRPADADHLAAQVRWAFDHPDQLRPMRDHARAEYLAKYSASSGYDALMDIYARALESARRRKPAVAHEA